MTVVELSFLKCVQKNPSNNSLIFIGAFSLVMQYQ